MFAPVFFLFLCCVRLVAGHASPWHPSMWGFNVTRQTFDYDNRPVTPLMNRKFADWWFHGYADYPPNEGDVFLLPAGQPITLEIACNKGATSYYNSSEGGLLRNPNNPNDVCPGSPPSEYHTTGIDDVKGCALAIAYSSDFNQVKPDSFAVISVNQTCVWYRNTDFGIPASMPPCPPGGCICSWFWIHSPDSGSEQMYMIAFRCNVTGSTSNVPLAAPKVARRCGADPANGKPNAVPGNCTYGAQQPLYWYQEEGNNMFEGPFSPPFYNDLYNFKDGPQDDIFEDSYLSIPQPGPNQTALPVLGKQGASVQSVSGGSSTTMAPSNTAPASATSPSAPSSATAFSVLAKHEASVQFTSGGSSTTTNPSHTVSAGATSPPATPSATPSGAVGSKSQCSTRRSASAFARRHDPAERRTPLAHRVTSMTRRRRTLDPERRSDVWKPF